jgi:hypothetical protein
MKNKKILIGSMLVLTLLLLMPSIPAIQIDSFKEGTQQNIDDLKTRLSNIESLIDIPKYFPLLFLFVYSVALFRLIRFTILMDLSTEPSDFPPYFTITNWLLFIRCAFLLNGIDWWLVIWEEISDHFGWGWEIPYLK